MYNYTSSNSLNGSCTARCTVEITTSTCTSPNSSALFDGIVPILTGFDRDLRKKELLTLRSSFTTITLNFSGTPNYIGVSRVEIAAFNCEQLGASIQTVTVSSDSGATVINTNITSCDSLVIVCIPNLTINSSITVLSLSFTTKNSLDWVYLAEVKVYEEGRGCQSRFFNSRPMSTTSGKFIIGCIVTLSMCKVIMLNYF